MNFDNIRTNALTHRRIKNQLISAPLSTLNKLLVPKGAAKSSKPLVANIEVEITENLKHQCKFNKQIEEELLKLNCKLQPFELIHESANSPGKSYKRTVLSTGKHPSSDEKESETPKSCKKTMKRKIFKRVEPLTFRLQQSLEKLPPLMKSMPIHKDPKFNFAKKTTNRDAGKEHCRRVSTVDSVIKSCEDASPGRISSFEDEMQSAKNEAQDIKFYIEDLVDSAKFSKKEKITHETVSNRKDNQRLDKALKIESKKIQRELNEKTTKVMKIGKAKHKNKKIMHNKD